jgi:hypothetical protein
MTHRKIVVRALWNVLMLMSFSMTLRAQTPAATFEELQANLKLHNEETIEITDANGMKYKAKIASISDRTLVVTAHGVRRELNESEVLEIRHRRPDKWWNGMLIGLAAGLVAVPVGVGTVCSSNDPECGAIATAVFLPTFAGIGMGAGAAIDFAIRKHETVFARPGTTAYYNVRIAPIVGKGTTGVSVSFGF